jgi:hypothetical protein
MFIVFSRVEWILAGKDHQQRGSRERSDETGWFPSNPAPNVPPKRKDHFSQRQRPVRPGISAMPPNISQAENLDPRSLDFGRLLAQEGNIRNSNLQEINSFSRSKKIILSGRPPGG